jgi:hypothetical protein
MQDEVIAMKLDELINKEKEILTVLTKMYSLLSKYDADYQNEVAAAAKED